MKEKYHGDFNFWERDQIKKGDELHVYLREMGGEWKKKEEIREQR